MRRKVETVDIRCLMVYSGTTGGMLALLLYYALNVLVGAEEIDFISASILGLSAISSVLTGMAAAFKAQFIIENLKR